jgi:hypothetical protein
VAVQAKVVTGNDEHTLLSEELVRQFRGTYVQIAVDEGDGHCPGGALGEDIPVAYQPFL